MPVSLTKAEKAMHDWLNANAEVESLRAEKRKEITPIEQRYAQEERKLLDKMAAAAETIEQYATENRDDLLPAGKKSTDFAGGKIGWKTSPPSLKLPADRDFGDLIDEMSDDPDFQPYVLVKRELDKSGLIRNAEDLAEDLKAYGLSIERKETFQVKA